ncbi:TIGR02647 family protein [Aeromonas sobria]|uniref:TIGR02647 family protein n=1 Tax=Aeromonas sobria TaxID=646 RepID=UPI003D058613
MIGIDQISEEFVHELKILACFDPANMSVGIKLRSDMSDALCQAAQRLHSQGLISAIDGGYLTPFGMTMVEHLQHLLVALKPTA